MWSDALNPELLEHGDAGLNLTSLCLIDSNNFSRGVEGVAFGGANFLSEAYIKQKHIFSMLEFINSKGIDIKITQNTI